MSIATTTSTIHPSHAPLAVGSRTGRKLHRLATIRRREGIALRTVARTLGIDMAEAARQEEETTDLPLSVLIAWQKALGVPVAELLADSDDGLSEPVKLRSQLVKATKTVASILEKSDQVSVRRLAEGLMGQLSTIMPELEGVGPWHEVGDRRRRQERWGKMAEQQVPAGPLGRGDSSDEAA